jgi:hypothetical protein
MRSAPSIWHQIALAALLLLVAACGRHSAQQRNRPDAIKPHAVTPGEVMADPEAAARKAIAAEDWRLIQLAGQAQRFSGLVCSVPRDVQDISAITYFRSDDLPEPSRDPRWDRAPELDPGAIARFNRAIVQGRESPWSGLCVDAEGWTGGEPEPWSRIGPVPADPPHDVLTRARLGLPETADEARHVHWDPSRRDLFGMTALSWAVIRRDKLRLAWMTRPPVDDHYHWCGLGGPGRERIPPAWEAGDPLVLAIRRHDLELLAFVLPVRSERKCMPQRRHRLFRAAWSLALGPKQDAAVEAVLPELFLADEAAQVELAEELKRNGYGHLAGATYYASREPDQSPLARAVGSCRAEDAAFWIGEATARRRESDLRAAWDRFAEAADWRRGADCLRIFRTFLDRGFKLAPGSALLAKVVAADVEANARGPGGPEAADAVKASELIALFRRGGGDPEAPARGPCPTRQRAGGAPIFCTPGEIAARGRTIFSALLGKPRALADQLLYDAAHNPEGFMPMETPIVEARNARCLVALDDPLARSILQACLDRGGKPVFVERMVQASTAQIP